MSPERRVSWPTSSRPRTRGARRSPARARTPAVVGRSTLATPRIPSVPNRRVTAPPMRPVRPMPTGTLVAPAPVVGSGEPVDPRDTSTRITAGATSSRSRPSMGVTVTFTSCLRPTGPLRRRRRRWSPVKGSRAQGQVPRTSPGRWTPTTHIHVPGALPRGARLPAVSSSRSRPRWDDLEPGWLGPPTIETSFGRSASTLASSESVRPVMSMGWVGTDVRRVTADDSPLTVSVVGTAATCTRRAGRRAARHHRDHGRVA